MRLLLVTVLVILLLGAWKFFYEEKIIKDQVCSRVLAVDEKGNTIVYRDWECMRKTMYELDTY